MVLDNGLKKMFGYDEALMEFQEDISNEEFLEIRSYDDVVNGGRLYTLRCFTSVMMIKYPWGKDYMRFEYKKFMKRLTTVRCCHHPRDPTTTDKSTTHSTF